MFSHIDGLVWVLKEETPMGDKPDNYFEKIESVKKILLPTIQGFNDKQIRSILCHCVYYKSERRKLLTDKEREVYDLLLSHKLSPKTTYNWFCLINAPDHVKQKVMKQEISFAGAMARSYAWRRMTGRKSGKEIMEEIKTIIGGLEWKDKNSVMTNI